MMLHTSQYSRDMEGLRGGELRTIELEGAFRDGAFTSALVADRF